MSRPLMIRSTLARALPWLRSFGEFFTQPSRTELQARIAELEQELKASRRIQRSWDQHQARRLSRMITKADQLARSLNEEFVRVTDPACDDQSRSPDDA